jgi:hypothetical protein
METFDGRGTEPVGVALALLEQHWPTCRLWTRRPLCCPRLSTTPWPGALTKADPAPTVIRTAKTSATGAPPTGRKPTDTTNWRVLWAP